MIEEALFFGLGFCAAALIALLCLPAVWYRAKRLVRRRLEMLVPLSMAEIAAERDGIRANAAVAQRRIEQRLERTRDDATAVAAELGRRTRDLVAAEHLRERLTVERDEARTALSETKSALAEAERQASDMTRQLQEMAGRFGPVEDERQGLKAKCEELDALAQERRKTIASLETRRDVLDASVTDLQIEIEEGRSQNAALRAAHADRLRERDTARNEALLATTQRTILQSQLQDESRRTEHYSVRWLAKAEALASAERRIVEQATEIKTTKAALAHLKTRFEALETRLIDNAGRPPAELVSELEIAEFRASITHLADDAMRLLQVSDRAEDDPDAEAAMDGPSSGEKTPRSAGALL